MCFVSVKEEEDYSVPARYKRVTRVRRYSPSPPRVERVSRTRYVEERRPEYTRPRSAVAPLPPPAPKLTTVPEPPPAPVPPPPPSLPSSTHLETTKSETVKSRRTSRAPSVRSVSRTHYVEVEHDEETSSSSSSSSGPSSKVPSKAASNHTRRSSKSKATTAPPPPPTPPSASEYSFHEREREFRRERGYSGSRPVDEYETYRYIDAPRSRSRLSGSYDPRASRDSYRRR
ncbi:hypothetical protein M433DRAFT_148608 [Acidomyces richmondensis BFW]|nr:MAG: hypothetical protein FE78DRAFT_87035 [Acidomyces sp. 'richmondensis']KYG50671.1 hypothetical protein M433DRAFT_148608 [Acidomyces richmondensis BFW]